MNYGVPPILVFFVENGSCGLAVNTFVLEANAVVSKQMFVGPKTYQLTKKQNKPRHVTG